MTPRRVDRSLLELVRHPLRMRRLEVVAVERPTPRLVRVTLGGPDLDGFCHGAPDDHVKVFFPEAGAAEPVLPVIGEHGVIWPAEGPRPIARDYTPFGVDLDARTMQLDLVLHDGGHAATWARTAAPGDVVGVAGPRGSHVLRRPFRAYLLAGDETALPAIRSWLATLPAQATAYAYVDVADRADEQLLASPARTMVRWLHRGSAAPGTTTLLDDALAELDLSDDIYTWLAGEAATVARLRRLLVDDLGVDPAHLGARGYWKLGAADHQEPHDD